jgi:hypothetical protein
MQEKLILSSIVFPVRSSETNALLLVSSIRRFAGALSQARIWCFVPQVGKRLSRTTQDRLLELNVDLIPFEIDHQRLRFFFATQITATALAESMAQGQTKILAWLDANTIVLQEPKAFLLPDDKSLGFRPVHHTLVGSRYDEPLDPFWTLVYRGCNVSEARVFPMTAHVDGVRIRPYFNAGLLITRPERNLLRTWRETFFRVYRTPDFEEFYQRDERYIIFAHQAILSGVILSTLAADEMQDLPPTYNYPLHLYAEDTTDSRPSRLEDLVTCRHEGLGDDLGAINAIPAEESLKQWIADQILP